MMAARKQNGALLARLPDVRGRYQENAPLSKITWFRVGGPAEILYRPADLEDLRHFLAVCPVDIPITVVGVGSNLLVRDGGIAGVVIRLADGLAEIVVEGTRVIAGAGASNLRVANVARDAGIAGLEFLSGIPGSIGGSLAMNAGAFGSEVADIFEGAKSVGPRGDMVRLALGDMEFSYRHSAVPADHILIEASLRGVPDDRAEITGRMDAIQAERATSQPTHTPTGGSTFINPPGEKAWQLIDAAGCRGLQRGDAAVSEKHCNFLINQGHATASDIEGLGEEVRRRVFEHSGIELTWEIRRIGEPSGPFAREVTE